MTRGSGGVTDKRLRLPLMPPRAPGWGEGEYAINSEIRIPYEAVHQHDSLLLLKVAEAYAQPNLRRRRRGL